MRQHQATSPASRRVTLGLPTARRQAQTLPRSSPGEIPHPQGDERTACPEKRTVPAADGAGSTKGYAAKTMRQMSAFLAVADLFRPLPGFPSPQARSLLRMPPPQVMN